MIILALAVLAFFIIVLLLVRKFDDQLESIKETLTEFVNNKLLIYNIIAWILPPVPVAMRHYWAIKRKHPSKSEQFKKFESCFIKISRFILFGICLFIIIFSCIKYGAFSVFSDEFFASTPIGVFSNLFFHDGVVIENVVSFGALLSGKCFETAIRTSLSSIFLFVLLYADLNVWKNKFLNFFYASVVGIGLGMVSSVAVNFGVKISPKIKPFFFGILSEIKYEIPAVKSLKFLFCVLYYVLAVVAIAVAIASIYLIFLTMLEALQVFSSNIIIGPVVLTFFLFFSMVLFDGDPTNDTEIVKLFEAFYILLGYIVSFFLVIAANKRRGEA